MFNRKLLTHRITKDMLPDFITSMRLDERSDNTIEKYVRYIQEFISWAGGADISAASIIPGMECAHRYKVRAGGACISKVTVIAWKEMLQDSGKFAPATINARIASVNAFFRFAGWDDCHVKALKLQRAVFRDPDKDLTKKEYMRLIQAANDKGDERLALILETLGGTGIRVSEIKYITVKAVNDGHTSISLKGKIRTIILPQSLCKKLKKYIRKNKITSGEVFLTKNGTGISRGQIWAEMKSICKAAGVEEGKVFPHNLRHLFARSYYNAHHDIVKLADMMGHSSIETTRLYLISTGTEHARQIDQLGLVS